MTPSWQVKIYSDARRVPSTSARSAQAVPRRSAMESAYLLAWSQSINKGWIVSLRQFNVSSLPLRSSIDYYTSWARQHLELPESDSCCFKHHLFHIIILNDTSKMEQSSVKCRRCVCYLIPAHSYNSVKIVRVINIFTFPSSRVTLTPCVVIGWHSPSPSPL